VGARCRAASRHGQKGGTGGHGRGLGGGWALPQLCAGSSAADGASGWTLVLLLWGPGPAPLCFCSWEGLQLALVSWDSPRDLELGTGVGPCGHPPQTGGLRMSSSPPSRRWLQAPWGSWTCVRPSRRACARGVPVPRQPPCLHAPCHTAPRQGSALACLGSPSCRQQDGTRVQAEDVSEERSRLHLLSFSFMIPSCQFLYLQIIFSLTNGCTSPAPADQTRMQVRAVPCADTDALIPAPRASDPGLFTTQSLTPVTTPSPWLLPTSPLVSGGNPVSEMAVVLRDELQPGSCWHCRLWSP